VAYAVRKRFTFEAAHRLPHHDGKCARLHGHSWVVWVEVAGMSVEASGPKVGMLIDFGDIAQIVRPIVDDYLDHHYLNETTGLESPTSELLAEWLFEKVAASGLPIAAVTIQETCTSECIYRRS